MDGEVLNDGEIPNKSGSKAVIHHSSRRNLPVESRNSSQSHISLRFESLPSDENMSASRRSRTKQDSTETCDGSESTLLEESSDSSLAKYIVDDMYPILDHGSYSQTTQMDPYYTTVDWHARNSRRRYY